MNIKDFLLDPSPLLDVRTPAEFSQGHIPGAISFPLFTDAERHHVGTVYKQESSQAAIRLGLHYVGPKLAILVAQADALAKPDKRFRLYCWRGGMRSGSLAWLLKTAGFHTEVLDGGYKSFRRWVSNQFMQPYQLMVVGGLTGSGKTELLKQLQARNEQVIDLEALANHSGSSFGHLGAAAQGLKQPSAEHFENQLARVLSQHDFKRPIFIEDESRMIGTCPIPEGLWKQMALGEFIWVESSKEERIQRLLKMYGKEPKEALIEATQRLSKRLGSEKTSQIVSHIKESRLHEAIALVLEYYDRAYLYSCNKRGMTDRFAAQEVQFNFI